ncbi:MAG: transglutaminase-like domain-containing protein [Candidatus Krumholzibacteriia bacterium]
MRPFALLLALLLGVPLLATEAPPPDEATSEQAVFTVKEKDGRYVARAEVTLTIDFLSERSTHEVVVPIGEDPYGKVDEVKARLNGEKFDHRVDLRYPQMRDVFFNEQRVWLVAPAPGAIKVGDHLTVTYEVTYDDLAYLPLFDVPNDDLLTSYELRFEHPANVRVDFDAFVADDRLPLTVSRDEPEVTVLRVDSLARRARLPYFDFNDQHALILASLADHDEPLTPNAPIAFCRWYLAQLDTVDATVPDSLAADLAAPLAAAVEPLAKLEAIHDFVRRNIRYVHEAATGHRFIPSAPARVLANRYGDCKDRAFLVQALARREGLEVKLALVSSRPHVAFDAGTCVFMFNHVIDAYATGQGWLLFDPTGRHVPFGELPEPVVGREALVIDADAPEQFTIAAPSDTLELDVVVTADLDTPAAGEAVCTLRGATFQAADEILAQARDPLGRQNALDQLLAGGLYKIKLEDYEVTESAPEHLVIKARADLSRFLVASPGSFYLPRIPFAGVSRDALERADDDLPLHLPGRLARRLRLQLHAPGLVAVADTTRLGAADLASYTAALTPDAAGSYVLEYTLRRQGKVFAGSAKTRYLEFCRQYLGAKNNLFTLKRGSS